MSKSIKDSNRIPRNFHKTFKPERQYLNAILRYSAAGKSGDYQQISGDTGIPMGASSGKVPPALDYCRAMGLITLSQDSDRSSIKTPELTPYGRVVLLEDPYLKSELTQWVCHLNMCSALTGADAWYHVFFEGSTLLGNSFKRTQLDEYLTLIYGKSQRSLIGPMIGMYEDDASFKLCAALCESNGLIEKKAAPQVDELYRGYGAWLVQLIHDYFPGQQQIPITDLDKISGWKTIPGWTISSALKVLDSIERKGLISVDRHMEPWLIRAEVSKEQAWSDIFFDMI